MPIAHKQSRKLRGCAGPLEADLAAAGAVVIARPSILEK